MESPPEPGHDARLPKLPEHANSIEFREVTLTYPRAARASLNQVNLTIRHGERVAVVGPNGCGKTTLLALIPRLFDPDVDASSVGGGDGGGGGSPRGSVLIDGVDIRTVNLRSLRRQVGVVTQETVLFKRSVRGNITYGTSGVSEEQMIDAAKRARAHDFIMRLPQGYDTEVAEQGSSLSGGQRQRIAIARAILRDPAILILDEATSMIDAESEAQINMAINEFSRGRTTLIVAHRLSTVLSADRIVVMDQGRIVDSGNHADLLGRCEVYRQLARHQLLGHSEADAIKA
jgi:ABC-type multidrug transport system fused ATPase/permease subunit